MKIKVNLITLLLCVVSLLCSCQGVIESFQTFLLSFDDGYSVNGIENYRPTNSSSGTSTFLLPTLDFAEMFDFIDGEYTYIYSGAGVEVPSDTELMCLIYEEHEYQRAKDYAYEKIQVNGDNHFLYNGYEFYENITGHSLSEDEYEAGLKFPYHFNMIAHNDEKCALLFIGFHCTTNGDVSGLRNNSIEDFLNKYFGYYDFDM